MRSAAGRALFVAEELQGAAQIGLDQTLAKRRHLAVGHPDRDVFGPAAEVVGVPLHVVDHDRVAGEAFGGATNRARRHVAEGHRAPALQRLEAGIGSGRHHGAAHADWNFAPVAFDEDVCVERPRPAADSGNCDDLAGLREADDHRRDPGDAHLIAVDHAEGEDRGNARVDRVATVLEHLECTQRRELVPSADDVTITACDGDDGHGNLRTV